MVGLADESLVNEPAPRPGEFVRATTVLMVPDDQAGSLEFEDRKTQADLAVLDFVNAAEDIQEVRDGRVRRRVLRGEGEGGGLAGEVGEAAPQSCTGSSPPPSPASRPSWRARRRTT